MEILSATQEIISMLCGKKKKIYKTCKPMKGKADGAERENKENRKEIKIQKEKKL